MLFCSLFLALVVIPNGAWAATKEEINASVDAVLQRFTGDIKGGNEVLKTAKGTLVIPNVERLGVIVPVRYGYGALRVGGKSVGYYNVAAGSPGLQIGEDLILCFMNEAALKKFMANKGWQVGLDGSVTVVTLGADGSVDAKITNRVRASTGFKSWRPCHPATEDVPEL